MRKSTASSFEIKIQILITCSGSGELVFSFHVPTAIENNLLPFWLVQKKSYMWFYGCELYGTQIV
jgi:hypothetical protein